MKCFADVKNGTHSSEVRKSSSDTSDILEEPGQGERGHANDRGEDPSKASVT